MAKKGKQKSKATSKSKKADGEPPSTKSKSNRKDKDKENGKENRSKKDGKQKQTKKRDKHKNSKSSEHDDEDNQFRASLQADGRYAIEEIDADGNCLFRSISDQLFHDHGNDHHQNVRSAVCDFMAQHEDDFSVFLVLDDDDCKDEEDAEDFESYVHGMREDGEWGGNLELVAAARLYRRNITVFSAHANMSAMSISHGDESSSSGPDLLVSYHDNDHYSSVRDTTVKSFKPHDIPTTTTDDTATATTEDKTTATSTTKSSSKPKDDNHPNLRSKTEAKSKIKSKTEQGKKIDDTGGGKSKDELVTSDNTIKKNKEGKEEALVPNSIPTTTCNNDKNDSNPDPKPVPERKPKASKRKGTQKRNAPCACGSNKKYSKCCWAKERHEGRLNSIGQDDDAVTKGDAKKEAPPEAAPIEMNGKFRVLKI